MTRAIRCDGEFIVSLSRVYRALIVSALADAFPGLCVRSVGEPSVAPVISCPANEGISAVNHVAPPVAESKSEVKGESLSEVIRSGMQAEEVLCTLQVVLVAAIWAWALPEYEGREEDRQVVGCKRLWPECYRVIVLSCCCATC